jgi:hypothetical protein
MPQPQRANFGGIPLLQQCVKSYYTLPVQNNSRNVISETSKSYFSHSGEQNAVLLRWLKAEMQTLYLFT